MSILKDTLSGLKAGTRIKVTQENGQTIDGIVMQNDGTESLSVQISSIAAFRYQQIASIEISGIGAPVPVAQTGTPEKPEIQILKPICDKDSITGAFKAMEGEKRKLLTPSFDKYQSFLKSHETEKLTEALEFVWNMMTEHEWDYHEDVNLYYARMAFCADEYYTAAESFYYADVLRDAYCSAYHGALEIKDKEEKEKLNQSAAAFSALALNYEAKNPEEATEVLGQACHTLRDISALEYLVDHNPDEVLKSCIQKVFTFLSTKSGNVISDITNLKNAVMKLKVSYPVISVSKVIQEYLEAKPMEQKSSAPEESAVPAPAAAPAAPPSGTYTGKIFKYKYFDDRGEIQAENGQIFPFNLMDISDISLKAQVKKITSSGFEPIYVKFSVGKRYGQQIALDIKRGLSPVAQQEPASSPISIMSQANVLFTSQKYEDAIALYRKCLNTETWEMAFTQIVMCYMALWNQNGDQGYSDELNALVDKYASKLSKTTKNMDTMHQLYMKTHRYQECLTALNILIDLCDDSDYKRTLHYLSTKARCYRFLGDYNSAIGQLNDWLEIMKKYKISENFQEKANIYIELAELYYETDDYGQAEKYANRAPYSERKHALLSKIYAERKKQEEEETETEETEDSESTAITQPAEPIVSVQEAYAEYTDEDTFEALEISDSDIAKQITSFRKEQLYCVLTYLSAASRLAASMPETVRSAAFEDISMTQAVQGLEGAFSYAFHNALSDLESNSTQILCTFENTSRLLPEINDSLFAAATLRILFDHSIMPDYTLDDLIIYIESTKTAEKFPSLVPLAYALQEFREKTGYGMDAFADYKTNSTTIEKIITEAKACCEAIEMRSDSYESQGQVRRMREILFCTPEVSEMRACLDIVAENDISRFEYVKEKTQELFIRNNKPIEIENIDGKKVDKYLDLFWDKARDFILTEKRHIERPYDKIKGGKRTNVIKSMKRIINCLCDWINAAEYASTENIYAKTQYADTEEKITLMLEELRKSAETVLTESGFDWGTESIRFTASELLAKLNGTYDIRIRKYLFIPFLTREEVLLNEDYLPELQSTFCGLKDFNLLSRILRHAESVPETLDSGTVADILSARVNEIFSNDITKSNLRSARLIKEFGEDMQIPELQEHKMFVYLDKCIRDGKKRIELLHENFCNEIELYESYGCISDINGEKSGILRCIRAWYQISRATQDYGFYARLLEVFRDNIAASAAEHGERLTRQLEELANNPEYDFGVYPKDKILEFIKDQNYTVAENMMNCVRRHDTQNVTDYTIEPFSYLSRFLSEYATNYRAVSDSSINMEAAILKYAGKKNIEFALRQLTNNASKDVKAGGRLIQNWLIQAPAGEARLEKLLTILGMTNATVTKDDSISEDAYKVIRKKQTGKVNYPHPIPAFGSLSETEGFRVLCLYGRFNCDGLMDKFREVNTVAKHTIVLLDFALNLEERRRLARKIKEEKSFAKSFIVIDRVLLFYLAKHYAANTISRVLMAVTMPFAYYQPFVEKSKDTMPPELFTGREAELVAIESAEGANLVYGGRQLGKSALLKMAQHNIDGNANGDRAVLVELIGLDYTKAASTVSAKLISAGILGADCQTDDWDTLAGYIEERLKDENPDTRINYLLLMLDEADKFIESCKEIDYRPISVLKNLPSGRFKVVMAGLHNLSRFNRDTVLHRNSILVHLDSVVIRPFQRPEAIKLLTNTLAYLGFRFKDDVISLILAKTNYFPGLIQLYCQKLLEAMKNDDYAGYSEVNTPSYEVTESHIKKVLSNQDFADMIKQKLEITLFVEEEGHSYYHIIALILSYLHEISHSETGYTIEDMFRVAEEFNITRMLKLKREQLEELLHEMWDLNILSANGEHYVFATEGFRELLGSHEAVEQKMSEYIGEGESA